MSAMPAMWLPYVRRTGGRAVEGGSLVIDPLGLDFDAVGGFPSSTDERPFNDGLVSDVYLLNFSASAAFSRISANMSTMWALT